VFVLLPSMKSGLCKISPIAPNTVIPGRRYLFNTILQGFSLDVQVCFRRIQTLNDASSKYINGTLLYMSDANLRVKSYSLPESTLNPY